MTKYPLATPRREKYAPRAGLIGAITNGGSPDADGLPLRLDHGDDALPPDREEIADGRLRR